jgi:hypothetical protein
MVERYSAIVSKNDDPDFPNLGRIFVKCLEITGDETTELPHPIYPAFDWGWFYVPDVDEEVEIEAVVEDDQREDTRGQAFLEEPRFTWRGKRFSSDEGDGARPINPAFTAVNYGKRRGFATPAGHVLVFDDESGDVFLTTQAGDTVTLLGDGTVNVECSKEIHLKSPKVHIDSGGDADQFLVRGDELKAWIEATLIAKYDAHKHPTAFGPSGPPDLLLASIPATVLSDAGKVK